MAEEIANFFLEAAASTTVFFSFVFIDPPLHLRHSSSNNSCTVFRLPVRKAQGTVLTQLDNIADIGCLPQGVSPDMQHLFYLNIGLLIIQTSTFSSNNHHCCPRVAPLICNALHVLQNILASHSNGPSNHLHNHMICIQMIFQKHCSNHFPK